jgi:head-tail adaptor
MVSLQILEYITLFNSGMATTPVVFETPTEVLDSLGAPSRSWSTIRSCFAQVENEQITASENIQAPYEQNTRTFTLVVRHNPEVPITTRDRVRAANNSWLGAITGMRYSSKKDVVYIDVETGLSAG